MLTVWDDERRRVEAPFTALPSYTAPRLIAACFGAMSVGVRATLYCAAPPHTVPRLNDACFGAICVGALGDPLLCCPPTLHLD